VIKTQPKNSTEVQFMHRIRHIISSQILDLWHLLSAIYQEED